jgi:propionyl-CoA carboxylase alpha chain
MIAKLVTHAPTRTQAIDTQADALDAFFIDGIRHNIPFLGALMQQQRFRAGHLSTGFIAEEYPDGFQASAAPAETVRTLAAVGAAIDHLRGQRRSGVDQHADGAPARDRRRVVRLGEHEILLDIERADSGSDGDAVSVRFAGADEKSHVVASQWRPGDPLWRGVFDKRPLTVQVRPVLNGFDLSHRGHELRAFVFTEREADAARRMPKKSVADRGKALRCPMPGLVVAINVAVGQDVKAGEPLAVVEAMKMENVLRAEHDGTVKAINVKVGDSLAVDAVILEFA